MSRIFISKCDICGKQNRYICKTHTVIFNAGMEWEDGFTDYFCILCVLTQPFRTARFWIKRYLKIFKKMWTFTPHDTLYKLIQKTKGVYQLWHEG
jgi:hypothetical protein